MSSIEENASLNPSEYSALRTFLRGYLHQDAAVEYGSPTAAARQFRRDADERETAVVHSELDRLLSQTASLPISNLARVLENLGSSWHFGSRQEVEQLRDALK
ncbi:MAG TPA: contact-dependent growth inhibition system immunity protein [Terriglobales bacterium]|nr:contact-dependent growth inhibition system immunity protein [Terriglobales bacterium]